MAVSATQFYEFMPPGLIPFEERALAVLDNFGLPLSFEATNTLFLAARGGKVEEVLAIMEEHYLLHATDKAKVMFLEICEKVLGLQPVVR